MSRKVTMVSCRIACYNEVMTSTPRHTLSVPVSPIKKIEIFNTHYQGIDDSWRAQITFADGTHISSANALPYGNLLSWISLYK